MKRGRDLRRRARRSRAAARVAPRDAPPASAAPPRPRPPNADAVRTRHPPTPQVFLNRLQAAAVADQALLFEYFCASHRAVVRAARANGTLDAGVADLRATSVAVTRVEVVGADAVSGAETRLSEVTLDRGASFDDALAKRDAGVGPRGTDLRGSRPAPRVLGRSTNRHGVAMRPASTDEPRGTPRRRARRRRGRPALDGSPAARGRAGSSDDPPPRAAAATRGTTAPPRFHTSGLGDDDRRASVGATPESFRGTGFYASRRPFIGTGKTGYMLAVRKANARNLYVLTRPNTGTLTAELTVSDLRARYVAHRGTMPDASAADLAALRRDWTEAYARPRRRFLRDLCSDDPPPRNIRAAPRGGAATRHRDLCTIRPLGRSARRPAAGPRPATDTNARRLAGTTRRTTRTAAAASSRWAS